MSSLCPFYRMINCFLKRFNTQHCLLVMLEKYCKVLDKGNFSGMVMTDLSKAFNCIDHYFLIAKLHASGFQHHVL